MRHNFKRSIISLAISQAVFGSQLVEAASITVNTTSDAISAPNCSFRDALTIINAGTIPSGGNGCTVVGTLGVNDKISFDLPSKSTINLTQGQLEITSTVSINGPGAEQLTIDANEQSRVLHVSSSSANGSVVDGITMTGGLVPPTTPFASLSGGGFRLSDASSVTLSNSVVTNNKNSGRAAGIYITDSPNTVLSNVESSNNNSPINYFNTAGIFIRDSDNSRLESLTVANNTGGAYSGLRVLDSDDVIIVDSVFEQNESTYLDTSSDGIDSGGGVAIALSDRVTIENSSITDNIASLGSGLTATRSSDLTINSVTIANNISDNRKLSYYGNGGSLFIHRQSNAVIINSTISGNKSTGPIPSEVGGGVYVDGEVSIINSTITNNDGHGLYLKTATAGLKNTVIANNLGTECNEIISIQNDNWFEDGSCNGVAQGNPLLGPLQDNGGDTLTHAPLENSGLIGAGSLEECNTAAGGVDQRNEPRSTSACNIGAVEIEVTEIEPEPEEGFFIVPLKNQKSIIFNL